jgi:hypothetical protein
MEENFLAVKADGRNVSRVAVIFSSVNANGFSYYNLFEAQKSGMHRIYIKDPFDQWYDRGISEEIGTWVALSQTILRAIDQLGATQVLTFGSSMGAYAAVRFAAENDASDCIAISPQTILDLRLPHTPKEPVADANRDLASILNSWTPKNAVVLFGAADFVDIYNVLRIQWRGAELFPIADQDHLVGQFLARQKVLTGLIEDFGRTGKFSTNHWLQRQEIDLDKNCFDPVQFQLICRIVEGYYLNAPTDLMRSLRALDQLKSWADGLNLFARLLARNGELDEAILQSSRAMELAPTSVTLSDAHAEILVKAGRNQDAIQGYRHSLKLRAKHYGALCRLGELLSQVGQKDEAIEMLKVAVEVRPRLFRAQKIAERFELDLG